MKRSRGKTSKKKDKKKHKNCATPSCHNIVAKDSKKGALCGICRKLEATTKTETGVVRKDEETVSRKKVEEPIQPSFAEKLNSLRRKVKE